MLRCPNCKEKVARFPLRKQSEKTFIENFNEGTINWINLFKMDLRSILGIIVIILLVTTYKADIKQCEEIITDPLKYCKESNACKIIEEMKTENPYGLIDIENIPEINING